MPTPRGGSSRLPGGACIPPVLEAWKHKILLAGKYLNVIRECGIGVTASRDVTTLDTEISMEDEKYGFVPVCCRLSTSQRYFAGSINPLKMRILMRIEHS